MELHCTNLLEMTKKTIRRLIASHLRKKRHDGGARVSSHYSNVYLVHVHPWDHITLHGVTSHGVTCPVNHRKAQKRKEREALRGPVGVKIQGEVHRQATGRHKQLALEVVYRSSMVHRIRQIWSKLAKQPAVTRQKKFGGQASKTCTMPQVGRWSCGYATADGSRVALKACPEGMPKCVNATLPSCRNIMTIFTCPWHRCQALVTDGFAPSSTRIHYISINI